MHYCLSLKKSKQLALLVALFVLLITYARTFALFTVPSGQYRTTESYSLNLKELDNSRVADFFSLATRFGTDKVVTDDDPGGHHYHNAYQKYLMPLRSLKIKFLEIGLGCDMLYGPGKSARLWKELFRHPSTEIWEAEVDVKCASKWNKTMNNRILTGDQADEDTLRNWISTSGGHFDIIIDDGGHTFKQQLTSLKVLFNEALRPGGIYFMEDLVSNSLGGGYEDSADIPVEKIQDWIKALMLGETLLKSQLKSHDVDHLQSIECFRGMCAFHKCPESTTAQCP